VKKGKQRTCPSSLESRQVDNINILMHPNFSFPPLFYVRMISLELTVPPRAFKLWSNRVQDKVGAY
jgi:hypothetical protein